MSDDNILEELQKYEAPTKVPPIADRAVMLYEAAGFKMTDEVVAELRIGLNKYADDLGELTDAIIGLGVFAIYLRDERDDKASMERIVRLIGEYAPKYFPVGERIVNALQDVAIKASDLFAQFSGGAEAKKRAPKYGAAEPPGTVSLKRLKPLTNPLPQPKRPPPAKKK